MSFLLNGLPVKPLITLVLLLAFSTQLSLAAYDAQVAIVRPAQFGRGTYWIPIARLESMQKRRDLLLAPLSLPLHHDLVLERWRMLRQEQTQRGADHPSAPFDRQLPSRQRGNEGEQTREIVFDPVVENDAKGSAPRRRDGGSFMVEVTESCVEVQSSAGMITQKCLTLISDPTQTYCETLLNGVAIGNDAGLGMSFPSSSATASAIFSTSSADSSATVSTGANSNSGGSSSSVSTATSNQLASTSRSVASAASSSSISIDAVANAVPASSVPSTSASASATSSAPSDSVSATLSPSASSTTLSNFDSSTSSTSVNAVVNPASTSASETAALSSVVFITSDSVSASASALPSSTGSIVVANAVTAAPSSAVASATVAAAVAAASTSAAAIPGQSLQVLPIGLGVFGGLVGVAIIIIGYVMYERRRYRGQFRSRKAAEKGLAGQGAPMGSGYGIA